MNSFHNFNTKQALSNAHWNPLLPKLPRNSINTGITLVCFYAGKLDSGMKLQTTKLCPPAHVSSNKANEFG